MKARPDNWDSMSLKEKEKFMMKQSTGVCNCTPAIGESCKKCKALIIDTVAEPQRFVRLS